MELLIPILFVFLLFCGFGIMIADLFYQDDKSHVIAGILIGVAMVFVVAGVVFAGCAASPMGRL